MSLLAGRKSRSRKAIYYEIDISMIPSSIAVLVKFMNLHPEFFKTNISKKIITINDDIYNIYTQPVLFNDLIHNIKGFIITEYDMETKILKMIVNIKNNHTAKSKICYIKQLDKYIMNQTKNGSTVELYYNKILSESIIKHCYYNQNIVQWKKDVSVLQDEFFLQEKDYLLSIMNNKIDNNNIGSTSNSWNNSILFGKPGTGKCLGYNTPVLMYDGKIKMVQNIVVNELVMGDDSLPRTVLSLARGVEEMYEIKQTNSSYMVNKSHILSLIYHSKRMIYDNDNDSYTIIWIDELLFINKKKIKSKDKAIDLYNLICNDVYINISVEDYIKLPKHMQDSMLGYKVGIEFRETELNIDAYYYGYWLVCVKENFMDNYRENIERYNSLYIPFSYKVNSTGNRLKILAGIIDSVGYYVESINIYVIEHMNIILLDDISFICKSLCFSVFIKDNRLFISGSGLWRIPVQSINKKSKHIKDSANFIIIEPIEISHIGLGNYYGFELTDNHKFVLGNFIVTHNSSFVYRTSMMLKMSIVSIDLSLYLNKKKELYALFNNQEFNLPNSESNTIKESALNNCIITLEEFDNSIEKLLDIENIFKYKDILKRNYLDLKNKELKQKSLVYDKHVINTNKLESKPVEKISVNVVGNGINSVDGSGNVGEDDNDDEYNNLMHQLMLEDGIDTKNNKVMDSAREDILEQRSRDNELHKINAELNNIIKEMDNDNKSNILRLSDLLELFQGPVPIIGRLIIATTNNFERIKKEMPALFRSGRMTAIEFKYLDWNSLNKLTTYYFKQLMTLEPFKICIPTSQIVELSVKHVLVNHSFTSFELELQSLCHQAGF